MTRFEAVVGMGPTVKSTPLPSGDSIELATGVPFGNFELDCACECLLCVVLPLQLISTVLALADLAWLGLACLCSDFVSNRWKRYERVVGTDTQLIADLSNLELAREESWWVWLNPFVLYDVIDLHGLKLYVEIVIYSRREVVSCCFHSLTVRRNCYLFKMRNRFCFSHS